MSPNIDMANFCEDLEQIIQTTLASCKLIIQGNFNAMVKIDNDNWDRVLGRYGVKKQNSNGLLCLNKCTKDNLFPNF